MHHQFLTAKQSENLTQAVLRYQKHQDNEQLHAYVRQHTQQLLYTIPYRMNLLPREDCGEFLLYCNDTIDHYLGSYRAGKLSYPDYILMVVWRRCRYFLSMKTRESHRKAVLDEQYFGHSEEPNISGIDDLIVAEPQPVRYIPSVKQPLEADMPDLYRSLVSSSRNRELDATPLPPVQACLREKLCSTTNRRRFLIMVLISPHLCRQYYLEELSLVLSIEGKVLHQYLLAAERVLSNRRQQRQSLEDTAHRHFRRLLEIQTAMGVAGSKEERKRLEELQVWTTNAFRKKIETIRNQECRLSHSQIATLLDLPRGTVASSVHYMKAMIGQCLAESEGDGVSS